ncbi:MAG: hypothetical protein WCL07_04375 [bacterium]
MINLFDAVEFIAPYTDLVFPGEAEDEKLLYVTRESPIMIMIRMTGFMMTVAVLMVVGSIFLSSVGKIFSINLGLAIALVLVLGALILFGGLWWMWQVYRKTLFIITTRRLTKFIHTTPWTRYQMSITIDKIVDSAAYSKGYLQAIFGLGTFVVRSSAGNIKNFKIENIHFAEDLHNWMNKLIFTFNNDLVKLDEFVAFAPKGVGKRG